MKASPLFAVLLSALLLQGCVAAAVVGVAGVATKTTTDPRTVGTQVDDGTGTMARSRKQSFDWYKKVISSNGEVL